MRNRITGQQRPQLEHEAQHEPHVPALAPPVHQKHAEHQEQEHLLLLGAASDNHDPGSGHSTRSEPRMGRANEQQRATPWLSTLQHSADLTLETAYKIGLSVCEFPMDNIHI